MKRKFLNVKKAILAGLVLLVSIFAPVFSAPKIASATVRSGDLIEIQAYDVEMKIDEDRKVYVKEQITVKFLKSTYNGEPLTMFYRSLPIEQARYYDISASCEGNDAFYFEVKNNPDMSGFFDINCIGGVAKDAVWTYDIAFTMENGKNAASSDNGMIVDVIPFGFTVDLHNVKATVEFPYAVTEENCKLYVGYGSSSDEGLTRKELSEDGKTLVFEAAVLGVHYNDTYSENVADGVTLDFTMDGKFEGYYASRLTVGLWILLLFAIVCAGGSVAISILMKSKREMITPVNIKAPDNMDPMRMGKILDGTVDNEDVTSMIYYFAHKGYLTIDLSDESNPIFTKRVSALPDTEKTHAKTLFKGLFASGEVVGVSDLKEKFYQYTDKAKMQLPVQKMYEGRSVLGYVLGGVLSVAFAVIAGLIFGAVRLGHGYTSWENFAFAIPVIFVLVLGLVRENYRYKWKKGALAGARVAQFVIMALFTVIYLLFFPKHVMTEYERLVLCLGAFAPLVGTFDTLSRTENYEKTLGEILGFKEFIVVTEEEKIKFMLEENPELYYKILPYAQVLGVTDEWEKKFKNILIEPPHWCTGTDMTVFDYMLLNRCMRVAMHTAMSRPQESGGGGSIGRSGGGGSFGGFGGGGFGGGGGGAR